MTNGAERDRREFFRMDDSVRLEVCLVPEEELEARLNRLESGMAGDFTVMSSLAAISASMAANMRKIEAQQPEVAAYLKAIDHKLEVIGRAFLAKESGLVAERAVPVNISAGGMAMGVNEDYASGSILEIKMLLFPSFTGILLYGTVVGEVAVDEEEARETGFARQLRIEFTHIREQDRDLLIRHILRKQGSELRAQREQQE